MTGFRLACVLFDLDGTLVDTAPDLIASLNKALVEHGFNGVEYDAVKPYISYGANAMIKTSTDTDEPTQAAILDSMLANYQNNIAQHSLFFQGIPEVLDHLEHQGLKWGVVTNKRKRFTEPLMTALNLAQRASCIISGDSTQYSKPHPEPMLAACAQAGVASENCLYIGDASHDIAAGKSANMKTLAALYGYLKPDDRPETWGADAMIRSPLEITGWLKQWAC